MNELRTVCDSPIELRDRDGKRVLRGYAAVFNSLSHDLGGFREVIRPGAFDATLKEIREGKHDVSARLQHEGGLSTIGRYSNGSLRLGTDRSGLWYEIDPPDTQAGRDAVTLIEGGYINKSSFAFRFRGADGRKWDRSTSPPTQELISVDLIDVAPVDGPAYEATTAQARSAAMASLQTAQMTARRSGVEVRANEATGPRVELYFLDQIVPSWLSRHMSDTMSSGEVIEALEAVPDAAGIDVFVNSPGGDAFEGVAIYNTLKAHPAPVNVYVRGLAASAAGIIAMAGDHIQMGEGSFLMMHNSWTGTLGNAAQHTKTANFLDKVDSQIAGILASRSKNDVKQVSKWMRDETWFTAEESIAAGFADRTEGDAVEPEQMDGGRCRELGYRNVPSVLGGRGAPKIDRSMSAQDYIDLIGSEIKSL